MTNDATVSGLDLAPSPAKALLGKSSEVEVRKRQFMPHITYFGAMDQHFGISHFWTDKIFALILFLQRFTIIFMWNVNWPQLYRKYYVFMYAFLLDFSAAPDGSSSLGVGSMLEGCETGCRVIWPLVCMPVVIAWSIIGLVQSLPLYYTRNIERIVWSVMRLGLLPFTSMLIRYYILNQRGNLDKLNSTWSTPTSELGVVFLCTTVGLFVYLGLQRSHRQVLFRSSIRHETYIKTRELEYRLRLSTTYRNERLWMISSYVYQAWFWSIARGVVDVVMVMIINFVPPKIGSILGNLILASYFAYGFVFDLYRVKSTTNIEHVYNATLFVYSIMSTIQAYGVTSTWLQGTQTDYFLIAICPLAVGCTFIMCFYYFLDSHRFLGLTVAERRANEKWRRVFGGGGGLVEMEKVELKTLNDEEILATSRTLKNSNGSGAFRRGSTKSSKDPQSAADEGLDDGTAKVLDASKSASLSQHRKAKKYTIAERKKNIGDDSFYVPRSGGFMSIDSGSDHVWPVNDGIINELLRLNQENHLIDMLRAARAMLDRVSSLHNTAILIPLDEIKTHIFRLEQCVAYCHEYRITHHCNLIHPLQSIFEDLIEQFTYELRIFSGISITVGHNAKKMINVSRELRIKQAQRDHILALVSPLMRRILVKLLALRLFMQLLDAEERRVLLGRPAVGDDEPVDDFGPRGRRRLPGESSDDDSSSDDEEQRLLHQSGSYKPKKKDTEQIFREEDPFADAEELDPFADNPTAFDFGDENQLGQGGESIFDEFRGVDANADERDNELARLLAEEAKKLILHKKEEPKKTK